MATACLASVARRSSKTRYGAGGGGGFAVALAASVLFLATPTAQANPQSSNDKPLTDVALNQKPGIQVPMDANFVDEHGKKVTLSDYAGKPIVVMLGYYRCKMLCDMIIKNLARTIKQVPYKVGEDYDVVFISIDPHETPDLALQKEKKLVGSSEDNGWHMLTGTRRQIDRVADAIGYQYGYDKETNQYAHPACAVVLTDTGKASRYLLGLKFASRDVKFALMDASRQKIGSIVDQILQCCYSYDPKTGRYGFAIVAALDIGAGTTVIGLALLVGGLLYKHRRTADPFEEVTDGDGGGGDDRGYGAPHGPGGWREGRA